MPDSNQRSHHYECLTSIDEISYQRSSEKEIAGIKGEGRGRVDPDGIGATQIARLAADPLHDAAERIAEKPNCRVKIA